MICIVLPEIYGVRKIIIGARLCGLARNNMHESHNRPVWGNMPDSGPWNRANDGPFGGLFRSYGE